MTDEEFDMLQKARDAKKNCSQMDECTVHNNDHFSLYTWHSPLLYSSSNGNYQGFESYF